MARRLTKNLKKNRPQPGARPGTLVLPPDAVTSTLSLCSYSADRYVVEEIESPSQVERSDDGIVWLDVTGLGTRSVIESLGEVFDVHPLALEDVVHVPQRPKAELYPSHALFTLKMTRMVEGTLNVEQLSVLWGDGFVVTVQERPGDVLDPVRQRLKKGAPIRERPADYLAYALVDTVVDHYFSVLEAMGERLDDLDESILSSPRRAHLAEIRAAKQDLGELKRTLWPTREALAALCRPENGMFSEESRLYLRDCLDHCHQLVEMVEAQRETTSSLVDLYMSGVGLRTNDIMQHLTLIATVFIPLSFLAGVFGMNFEHMPELGWRWSYPIFWLIVIALVVGMRVYFARRGWLHSEEK